MNDLVRFANSVEYTTGKKRGRHPVFNSNMFYPYKAERRLQAATKKEFETYILEAYEVAVVGETFTQDSLEDLSNLPERISEGFRQEISYAADSIAKKVSSNIANMSEMVVGRPYYPPTAKESLLKDWQANFQTLCKSAESDAKKEISRLVQQAKDEGWNRKQLERAVKKLLPEKYASRAALIARTESANLNTQVTLSTYKEIGVEYYVWMAAMDERTRPEHAMMNGLICSATDPTVWYEENPDDPMHPIEHKRDDTMVHLHPGEDYQCRCTMVMWDPVIDGKYEVKEGEKPEEPEEKPENEPESRELEKANKRLAEQEKELEKAENGWKTAEKELAQEKSARKAAEKAQRKAESEAEKQVAENERLRAENEKALKEVSKSEKKIERVASSVSESYKNASENLAKRLFPEESWKEENGVMISETREKMSKKSKNATAVFEKEKKIAEILCANGNYVWMLPENRPGTKNPDAIVNGSIYDFKQVKFNRIEHAFVDGLKQADNVVIRVNGDGFEFARLFGKLKKHIRGRKGRLLIIVGRKYFSIDFSDIR